MTSWESILISGYDTARIQTNRYLTTVVFIIGVIGSLFNVLVFSHSTLNRLPTTRYFLAASGASIASLTSGLLGQMFVGWAADPASRNTILCKFQAYTNKLGQTSCSYFLLAATIDRWLQSNCNNYYRQISSIKNSTRIIALILLVFGIYHSIHIVCFEAFLSIPPTRCYAGSIPCRYFETLSYTFVTILIPKTLTLAFGWKIILNLRQMRRQIAVHNNHNFEMSHSTITNGAHQTIHQTKVRSLTRMLIIQVLAHTFLTLPAALQTFYMALELQNQGDQQTPLQNQADQQTALQVAIDRFFFSLTAALSYTGISLPFYLYTLTGPTFRQTLIKILSKLKPH